LKSQLGQTDHEVKIFTFNRGGLGFLFKIGLQAFLYRRTTCSRRAGLDQPLVHGSEFASVFHTGGFETIQGKDVFKRSLRTQLTHDSE